MAVRKKKTRDSEDWEDLCDFLDKKEFYIEDMLACTCATLFRNAVKEYKTSLMVAGVEYEIMINEKRDI